MSEVTKVGTRGRDGSVFMGFLLLGLGAIFLLDNLGVVYIGSFWSFWPFILVAFGIQKIVLAEVADQIDGGLWMVFIGCWLYVSIEEVWGLDFGDSWPALLIAWGIGLIWRAVGRPWPFLRKGNES